MCCQYCGRYRRRIHSALSVCHYLISPCFADSMRNPVKIPFFRTSWCRFGISSIKLPRPLVALKNILRPLVALCKARLDAGSTDRFFPTCRFQIPLPILSAIPLRSVPMQLKFERVRHCLQVGCPLQSPPADSQRYYRHRKLLWYDEWLILLFSVTTHRKIRRPQCLRFKSSEFKLSGIQLEKMIKLSPKASKP